MNEPRETHGPDSLSRMVELEAICDRFDLAWRRGEQPGLEQFLGDQHAPLLVRNLLEIEVEYRSQAGEVLDPAALIKRFPAYTQIVEEVCNDENLRCSPSDIEATKAPPEDEAVGTVVGRYRLLQPLGEGGFGTVFLAEQKRPVRRRVAFKIIKLGMDTKQVIARFEAERQALALMDHPHIAKVFDAGATHAGRPYFVMELVNGAPITNYCDRHNVSLDERLQLFQEVCGAVQHAHQKGIIHRDIKPSNVLVTQVDDQPTPKVIDFGIAKATAQRLTEHTVLTEQGQFIGTPAYMSPEQMDTQAFDIDTRSDVYSLGVLLYELLTGTTPFDVQRLAKDGASLDEIKRIIREQEPSKPSTKLSTLGQDASTVANRRGLEPTRLQSLLRGDLDGIVMKALEKDRRRRYETASAFAEDIGRYLADEPVQARPPSRGYRLSKYIRRHKTTVGFLSALFALLAAGIIGTSIGLARAERERAKAVAMANRNQKVIDAFVEAFWSPNPWYGDATNEMSAMDVLKQAQERIGEDEELNQDELTKAQLLEAIGSSLFSLGALDEAISAYEQSHALRAAALGAEHIDTMTTLATLAQCYSGAGQSGDAIAALEMALPPLRKQLGEGHRDTLITLNDLGTAYLSAGNPEEAIPRFEEALRLSKQSLGPTDADTLMAMRNLGRAYDWVERIDEAMRLLEQALQLSSEALGDTHPDTLVNMNFLCAVYGKAGQLDKAVSLAERAAKLTRGKLGPDHPQTLLADSQLASVYDDAGKADDAISLYENVWQRRKQVLGPEHPDTVATLGNLGLAHLSQGNLVEAIRLLDDTLKLSTEVLGRDHQNTLTTQRNLATAYKRARRFEEAVNLFEDSLSICESAFGSEDRHTLLSRGQLAGSYASAGRLEEAISTAEVTLPLLEQQLGLNHRWTLTCMVELANFYEQSGKPIEALSLFEKAFDRSRADLGPDHPKTLARLRYLQASLLAQQRFEEAEPLIRDWLAALQRTKSAEVSIVVSAQISLAESLLGQGRTDEALDQMVETSHTEGLSDRDHARADSVHGAILVAMGQYERAEQLLINSFHALRQSEERPPRRETMQRAGERIISLYETWGKPEDAVRWKAELQAANIDTRTGESGSPTEPRRSAEDGRQQ